MRKHKNIIVMLLLLCMFLSGCAGGKKDTETEKEKTIYEINVPKLLEHCVDEAGQYMYYTVNAESVIYKCTMDGTVVAQFPVTADEAEPEKQDFMGEQPPEAINLCGLCMAGDTLYCFRPLKETLLAIDVQTGENRLLAKTEISGINKMAAGASSVLIMTYEDNGNVVYAYQGDTQTMERVSVKNPVMLTGAKEDTYWINVTDDEGIYYFQKYDACTGTLSEKYKSNFTYELSELAYDKESNRLYGKFSEQYVCFAPEQPTVVSRFTAQDIYSSPAYLQISAGSLYIQDREKETIYHFDPTAFMIQNKPLKGYVTSEFALEDWAGYQIELEVISWEELALKVLAEDRDYDFVVMTTDAPEVVAIRDAMAYLPIPEEVIENYWTECWPCIREGATYQGDIWMLPLQVHARGLVYSEQNLKKYALSIENIKTTEDLHEAAKVLYENGETGRYSLGPMQNVLLQNYLWKYQQEKTINFDTPEFRSLMEFIRQVYHSDSGYRDSDVRIHSSSVVYEENSSLTYQEQWAAELGKQAANIYFEEVAGDSWDYEKYVGAEGIRVCAVPGMTEEEQPVQVNATVLILNPGSSNKEELLDFVAAMSEAYLAAPDSYLSADKTRYSDETVVRDVCELYRNGEMVFRVPEDLFETYYLYVMGQESDPEKVVKELNRVVNMYYGE